MTLRQLLRVFLFSCIAQVLAFDSALLGQNICGEALKRVSFLYYPENPGGSMLPSLPLRMGELPHVKLRIGDDVYSNSRNGSGSFRALVELSKRSKKYRFTEVGWDVPQSRAEQVLCSFKTGQGITCVTSVSNALAHGGIVKVPYLFSLSPSSAYLYLLHFGAFESARPHVEYFGNSPRLLPIHFTEAFLGTLPLIGLAMAQIDSASSLGGYTVMSLGLGMYGLIGGTPFLFNRKPVPESE